MEIRRTANAGVLLKLDGISILMDGVCREIKPYPATPPEERDAICASYPDMVCFTHAHKDHYDPSFAAEYEKQTGVRLVVETAASGTYESTLTARMATSDAPTIFQFNGPIGYASWAEYCADLKDTELYKHLNDKSLAIASNGGVYGIPYVVEGYGIIYNKKILDAYFAKKLYNPAVTVDNSLIK